MPMVRCHGSVKSCPWVMAFTAMSVYNRCIPMSLRSGILIATSG